MPASFRGHPSHYGSEQGNFAPAMQSCTIRDARLRHCSRMSGTAVHSQNDARVSGPRAKMRSDGMPSRDRTAKSGAMSMPMPSGSARANPCEIRDRMSGFSGLVGSVLRVLIGFAYERQIDRQTVDSCRPLRSVHRTLQRKRLLKRRPNGLSFQASSGLSQVRVLP